VSEYPKIRLERTDTSPHTAHQFDPAAERAIHWPDALFNRPSIMVCSVVLARKLLKAQPQNFKLVEGDTLPNEEPVARLDEMTMHELKAHAAALGLKVPITLMSKARVREFIETGGQPQPALAGT
jgi:hypothetical protein